jgi:hypothetical protein
VTDFIYAIGHEAGSAFTYIGLAAAIGIMGFAAFLGFLGQRLKCWAFVVGIAGMAGDALFLLWLSWVGSPMIVGLLLHAAAIYRLGVGYKSAKLLLQRRAAGKA